MVEGRSRPKKFDEAPKVCVLTFYGIGFADSAKPPMNITPHHGEMYVLGELIYSNCWFTISTLCSLCCLGLKEET